jgi:hypothetical protein
MGAGSRHTERVIVLRIRSATWSVRLHFDTVISEMCGRRDATAQQQRDRAPEAAGGQDDLPRGDGNGFPVPHAGCGLNAANG